MELTNGRTVGAFILLPFSLFFASINQCAVKAFPNCFQTLIIFTILPTQPDSELKYSQSMNMDNEHVVVNIALAYIRQGVSKHQMPRERRL